MQAKMHQQATTYSVQNSISDTLPDWNFAKSDKPAAIFQKF
jgi:hypothetical protein